MKCNELCLVVMIVAVIGVAYYFYGGKLTQSGGADEVVPQEEPQVHEQIDDPLHSIGPYDPQEGVPPERGAQMNPVKQNTNVLPYPQISNNYAPQQANLNGQLGVDTGNQPKLDCFPRDTITPQELMPREDSYNTWQLSSPPVNGHLTDRNFLESGYHFGIDTISNTLKNANLQLRSDPVIPQVQVGPWSQSTYGPDTNHRQFDIGGDY